MIIRGDAILDTIIDYTHDFSIESDTAWTTARWCLMDSLGCMFAATRFAACAQLLGPLVPDEAHSHGVPIPATTHHLAPVEAAFNIGTLVRWLDFNDTWLAAEWGHPSDNLGAILATADYRDRHEGVAMPLRTVLEAMIKAYEIQGVLALGNSLNQVGLDHVLFVKIASTAVGSWLLGNSKSQTRDALSQAWLDGGSLRAYRHAPNAGSRKSWAAGDATARAVWLALITRRGEPGYATPLSAPHWGFQDVLLKRAQMQLLQPLQSYVIENILFKIAFPAEFHAQTAVECAMQLHPQVVHRLDQIEAIAIQTHDAAIRIIDKSGPLRNPADRDHCLQYMIAIGLLFGELRAAHYEDSVASDPRIDRLRSRMTVKLNPRYSADYLDPQLRSIPNWMQIHFHDGSQTEAVEVHFPLGHRRRRSEALPLLMKKFESFVEQTFEPPQAEWIVSLFASPERLDEISVSEFLDRLHG